MAEKIVIVGGVAGGASAAARARRVDEHAQIVLFERDEFVSFANCGLPYYVGGEIKDRDSLLVATVDMLKARFNIDIRTFSEVVKIDRAGKTVRIKNRVTGEEYDETYGKLLLAPGAAPIKPPLEGIDLDTIFTVRNIPDTDRIKEFVDTRAPESAVVVGGGFIGLEMAEQLVNRGVRVSIVEMLDQVMPPMDYDMACIVHEHLMEKGVELRLGDGVKGFRKQGDKTVVTTQSGAELGCDLVVLSIGVRPENGLAKDAGLDLGERGGIIVNDRMQTSDPDIYAVGDAVEIKDFVSGTKAMIPLGGPANRQARIAADNMLGRSATYRGTQGTAVVRVFDLTVASTGMSEKLCKRLGVDHLVSYTHSGSHAGYYPGAEMMAVKLVFAPGDGKVLGGQTIRKDGAAKRIDVIAMAIQGGMTVFDLEEAELAYAPPFGSAKDPVNIAGFVAANMLKGDFSTVNWPEMDAIRNDDSFVLLDVRMKEELDEAGEIPGAQHIPLPMLRARLDKLDRSKTYVPFCAIGLRGYIACRILTQNGFKAKNLSGGYKTWKIVEKQKKA
jgi:NADPH-dependent 2,4-dienoyl-CoA reductase/sulfur reductase-like enzyme/rhodanese-related sulfurtransferase